MTFVYKVQKYQVMQILQLPLIINNHQNQQLFFCRRFEEKCVKKDTTSHFNASSVQVIIMEE